MTPATWPRPDPLTERLLIIDPAVRAYRDAQVRDLPACLRPGDVLVVNDAATLPASLPAIAPSGRSMELRLVGERADGSWDALLFGEGDWRTPTERRPEPDLPARGEVFAFEGGLSAKIERVSAVSPRLVAMRFSEEGSALWSALYRIGRPVQYSYMKGALALWHVQTHYGARPWAVELPSAGRPLTWRLLRELARTGVRLASVTHAAGLSSTGDPSLYAALPFPERYDVPLETVRAVEEARSRGGRAIAVGTTVVRALEGCAKAHGGALAAGSGLTDLVIGPGYEPLAVDGLLTGLHEPAASHFSLVQAFAPPDLLRDAYAHAEAVGYLHHEFGDSCLILPHVVTPHFAGIEPARETRERGSAGKPGAGVRASSETTPRTLQVIVRRG